MKKFLLIVFTCLFSAGAFAQGGGVAPLDKGQLQINFGAGIANSGIPTFVSLDIALHKDVTLTPEVHVRFPFPDYSFRGGMLCKADYHWNYLIGIPSNFDFYAGARVGFEFGGGFYPRIGGQVGGRWYWAQDWGMNLELAFGTGFGFTFGLSKKL
jgi:hypothetical protein